MTFPQRMKGARFCGALFYLFCPILSLYPDSVLSKYGDNAQQRKLFRQKLLILHKNVLYCFQNDPVGLFHRRSAIHARACAESKGNARHVSCTWTVRNRTRRTGSHRNFEKREDTTMIMNPTAIKHVVVDGHSLTLESFVAIARYNASVELAPFAEKIAAEAASLYGITTAGEILKKVVVPAEMSNQFSTNRTSHYAAGEPYADEIVRGMTPPRQCPGRRREGGPVPLLVDAVSRSSTVSALRASLEGLGSPGDPVSPSHDAPPCRAGRLYEGREDARCWRPWPRPASTSTRSCPRKASA